MSEVVYADNYEEITGEKPVITAKTVTAPQAVEPKKTEAEVK